MKRGWKIFFIIFAIILIILACLGIYAYHTYKIIKELQKIQTNYAPVIKMQLQQIMTGDCSGKKALEQNVQNTEKAVSDACSNFILKKSMLKIAKANNINQDPCLLLEENKNPFPKLLNFTDKVCTQGITSITSQEIQDLTSGMGAL
jgi:hypothetical protein